MQLKKIISCFSRIGNSRSISEQRPCLQFYRSIQILEKYFNGYLMKRIVPMIVLSIPIIQVVSQYVCIQLHDEIPMPGFLIFPLIMFDCVLANVFVYSVASWVYSKSIKVLRAYARHTVKFSGRKSRLAREIKACAVLKIKFGSNFIDNGTPLVIQDFCMNQTVSLLLINSGNGTPNL